MRKHVEESVATGAAAGRGRGGRFSAGRKREVVMRLLRGEDLESGRGRWGPAARASHWRAQFLAAGQAGLKSRATDARDEDHRRLHKIGELVTNLHVIENAAAAQIVLFDQSSYRAQLVGFSAAHDLAVMKIDAPPESLRPVDVGRSDNLRVGQNIYAIGNPFGLSATLTIGIVSALGREIPSGSGGRIENVIQTDADINPGNSGGPLLDSSGRLIGVNTAIYSPSGASAGIGLAVPVDTVRRVVPQIIADGGYVPPRLGIRTSKPLNDSVRQRLGISGVVVLAVDPGTGAAQAGLQETSRAADGRLILGDVIQAVETDPVSNLGDLQTLLDRYESGDDVRVTILRDRVQSDVTIRVQ